MVGSPGLYSTIGMFLRFLTIQLICKSVFLRQYGILFQLNRGKGITSRFIINTCDCIGLPSYVQDFLALWRPSGFITCHCVSAQWMRSFHSGYSQSGANTSHSGSLSVSSLRRRKSIPWEIVIFVFDHRSKDRVELWVIAESLYALIWY